MEGFLYQAFLYLVAAVVMVAAGIQAYGYLRVGGLGFHRSTGRLIERAERFGPLDRDTGSRFLFVPPGHAQSHVFLGLTDRVFIPSHAAFIGRKEFGHFLVLLRGTEAFCDGL